MQMSLTFEASRPGGYELPFGPGVLRAPGFDRGRALAAVLKEGPPRKRGGPFLFG
jgi:hypothetical protein